MARAIARCTCRECGREFVRYSYNHPNRRSADQWEEWAQDNIDLCSECWKKQQDAIRATDPFDIRIAIGKVTKDYVNVEFRFISDNTYIRRYELKAVGCFWNGTYWIYELKITDPDNFQIIQKTHSMLEERLGKCRVARSISKSNWAAAFDRMHKLDAELTELGPIPPWPDDIKSLLDGKWNRKFYGKDGNWCIYVDETKIALSDEQKALIEERDGNRQEWRDRKKEIMADM